MPTDWASIYNSDAIRSSGFTLISLLSNCVSMQDCREVTARAVSGIHRSGSGDLDTSAHGQRRDCARALESVSSERSEEISGFSVLQAVYDISRGISRPDLTPAFHAEILHILKGIERPSSIDMVPMEVSTLGASGREAAILRSGDLDRLWSFVESWMNRYPDGLHPGVAGRREERRQEVLHALGGRPGEWRDWHWQSSKVIRDPAVLGSAVELSHAEMEGASEAARLGIPFGMTPYYASLLGTEPPGSDAALHAQVIPGREYAAAVHAGRMKGTSALDFMQERDTTPVDLVTRRYPAIVILKPYNACPQICVYCQRNWEIEGPMSPGALAGSDRLEQALDWIETHPAIREVLLTGGDPLAMENEDIAGILDRLARIPQLELVRIGTRIPVTMPMRITRDLAGILGGFRSPGRRDLCVVTHVQSPLEVTRDFVDAVDRICRCGISVYNQMVFTFHVSRRFEAARLRMLLRKCGVDPYYTFVPKCKEETASYRVPIARILQEQKEESRLLPGSRRTDTPVFNVPGLGKNHIRAAQHRDLLSILPDGARVYEFHPWEKNIARQRSWIGRDVPVLDYLSRLGDAGEDPSDYASIWFYY
jgi:lysine 2,3-aminomutase